MVIVAILLLISSSQRSSTTRKQSRPAMAGPLPPFSLSGLVGGARRPPPPPPTSRSAPGGRATGEAGRLHCSVLLPSSGLPLLSSSLAQFLPLVGANFVLGKCVNACAQLLKILHFCMRPSSVSCAQNWLYADADGHLSLPESQPLSRPACSRHKSVSSRHTLC
jgi:hypothetical protein